MSFRAELNKHLTALPVSEVKKLVSKYNKELDIKPISKLKKAEIIEKIKSKKPMDKQLLAKLTNDARATVEGRKTQKASEKEEAKKPVKKVIKVKKSKPDFLDLDKDGDKKEPMKKAAKEAKKPKKSAPKAMSKKDAKAFADAFAKAPEEEKGSLFSSKAEKKAVKKVDRDFVPVKVGDFIKTPKGIKPITTVYPTTALIKLNYISTGKEKPTLELVGGPTQTNAELKRKFIKKINGGAGGKEPKNKMPSGVHIHLDGKTMKYNSVKEGQAAFDKIRSNRSKKPYKKMTLMDGDKILDYSA